MRFEHRFRSIADRDDSSKERPIVIPSRARCYRLNSAVRMPPVFELSSIRSDCPMLRKGAG